MFIDPEHRHLVTGPVAEKLADIYRQIGHVFREMKEEDLAVFKAQFLCFEELQHTALADANYLSTLG